MTDVKMGDNKKDGQTKQDNTNAQKTKDERGIMWVEKYRPSGLGSVVGNDELLVRLRLLAKFGNLPNLLLCGPPGIGKTTSVLCLARELLGSHVKDLKDAVLELNASDARGIDVVRGKIKLFAQTKVTLPEGLTKIVILDEADAMTSTAQQGLRRLMDRYASTTRFALACNSVSKIIDAVQSRSMIVRFSKVADQVLIDRLKQIAAAENVTNCSDQGLKALAFTAQGDLRLAINNLQAVATGLGDVTPENVFKVADQPHPSAVASMMESCCKGNPIQACSEMQMLWKLGYSPMDIIITMLRLCQTLPTLIADQKTQIAFVDEIGRMHVRIADGHSSLLQLNGLVARLSITKPIKPPIPPIPQIHS